MFAVANILFWIFSLPRLYLAQRYARRPSPPPEATPELTILQPILGGDRQLEECLRRNALANPTARFLWLVDEDDNTGRLAAEAARQANVEILLGPGPAQGENPKLAKLDRAFPLVQSAITVVLDDDTVLPRESLEVLAAHVQKGGGLVTGLPAFYSDATIWERLLGGFINGNAHTTYFAVAEIAKPATINGMIYAFSTEEMRGLGGFAAAGHALTDDYAVAKLFHRHGLHVAQANAPVEVRITVNSARDYARLMRRWMIFARTFFREHRGLAPLVLAGLPSFLPLLPHTWPSLALYALLLRKRAHPLHHFLSALLTPYFFLSSLCFPSRLSWRTRNINLDGGVIRYR
jgi:ceramide glucosyltransferase